MKNSIDLLTKTVSAVLAKYIDPEVVIPPVTLTSVPQTSSSSVPQTSSSIPVDPTSVPLTPTSIPTSVPLTPTSIPTSVPLTPTSIPTSVPLTPTSIPVDPTSVSLTPTTPVEDLLPPTELTKIYSQSCSRRNFSVNLTRRLFDKSTRMVSNISGGRGKRKLNSGIIAYIKSKSFDLYPALPTEIEKVWKECIVSIDESSLRLNNKPRKDNNAA